MGKNGRLLPCGSRNYLYMDDDVCLSVFLFQLYGLSVHTLHPLFPHTLLSIRPCSITSMLTMRQLLLIFRLVVDMWLLVYTTGSFLFLPLMTSRLCARRGTAVKPYRQLGRWQQEKSEREKSRFILRFDMVNTCQYVLVHFGSWFTEC